MYKIRISNSHLKTATDLSLTGSFESLPGIRKDVAMDVDIYGDLLSLNFYHKRLRGWPNAQAVVSL